MDIILASQSPRRRELLAWLVPAFSVMPADIDEEVKDQYAPVDYVKKMAADKAAVIASEHSDALVIASDTIVVIDNQILGKPVDRAAGFAMLRQLSGRTHDVYTAVTMRQGDKIFHELATAKVTFYELTDQEINRYLDTGDYADKAGAYGIQSLAGTFVQKIDGDYYSIVGFPIGVVQKMLNQFN
ncbi:Maf family protein [Enterococcus sp. LJL90]